MTSPNLTIPARHVREIRIRAMIDFDARGLGFSLSQVLAPRALHRKQIDARVGDLLLIAATDATIWAEVTGFTETGELELRPFKANGLGGRPPKSNEES